MEFEESDLVRVVSEDRARLTVGIVLDVDPSEDAPTYYLVSVAGQPPEWYLEDEVFSVQEIQPVKEDTSE